MQRLKDRIRDLWAQRGCLIRLGHDEGVMVVRARSLFVQCGRCGCLSPGIHLATGPTLKYEGDPDRHRMYRHIIGTRPLNDLACHDPLRSWSRAGRRRLVAAVFGQSERLLTQTDLQQLTPEDLAGMDIDGSIH